MDAIKSLPDEFQAICKETTINLSPLTNESDCRESFGHLLRIRHNASARELALINIKEHCPPLIVYSDRNAFFPGLHIVYNRSNMEAFYSKPNNLQRPAPRTPDFDAPAHGIRIGFANFTAPTMPRYNVDHQHSMDDGDSTSMDLVVVDQTFMGAGSAAELLGEGFAGSHEFRMTTMTTTTPSIAKVNMLSIIIHRLMLTVAVVVASQVSILPCRHQEWRPARIPECRDPRATD
ncbi:MAG: hypothetical protein HC783_11295 [Rhodobacteraceae bacterium]|nr:hypothetical protein [Paracoccaceae bacterium]